MIYGGNDRIVVDGSCTLTNVLNGSCTLTNTLDGSAMSVLEIDHFNYYTGAYTVVPKAHEAITLPTHGLMMSDDVAVQKVPYYETSNIFDGLTVYIAEETNG